MDPFALREWPLARGRSLTLGPRGLLMGIVNVTPDSFSDGGLFEKFEEAVKRGLALAREGAAIIDVGGESTRPGAEEIDGKSERGRILPVIRALAEAGVLVSVDTYRAETAEAALEAGAHIVNDVWGCQREPDIAEVAARNGAGLVIMHTGRNRQVERDTLDDQIAFFKKSLEIADQAGVSRKSVVIDPGIGFAKDAAMNLTLLKDLDRLHVLNQPLMLGTSRKRFLGTITGRDAADRDNATAATTALARAAGVALFRVHSIPQNRDAVRVADAIRTGEAA